MKKRRTLLFAFFIVAILSLGLAACGDRNTNTPVEPTRPPRDVLFDPNAPLPPMPSPNPDGTFG